MFDKKRMEGQRYSRRKKLRRFVLFCSAGVGAVTVGWLLSAALYVKYQGASLNRFCNESLIGESSKQVVVVAREGGFETLEKQDLILLTMPGRRHGRTCYLSIGNGIVADVKSAFSW